MLTLKGHVFLSKACSKNKDNTAGINLLKVNTKNTKTRYEVCSKLIIKTPKRRHWRFGVFIVNFEHISHLVLVFLLTLNIKLPAGKGHCSLSHFIPIFAFTSMISGILTNQEYFLKRIVTFTHFFQMFPFHTP